MKNAMDAGQSSNRVLEITPFLPLILREREVNNLYLMIGQSGCTRR
jgi:hypothetical protein